MNKLEIAMFRQSMFVILGLMAAVTLGCEKKQETPAVPSTTEAEKAMDEHAADAHSAVEEMKEDAKEAADNAAEATKEAVKEGAEKVEEGAQKVQDAVSN
jgi:hypothetical protein